MQFQESYAKKIKISNLKKKSLFLIIVFSFIDDFTLNSDEIKGF